MKSIANRPKLELKEDEEKYAFDCKICPDFKTNSEISLKIHNERHKNQKIMCRICCKGFIYKSLVLHLLIVHKLSPDEILQQLGGSENIQDNSNENNPYNCKECPSGFSSYSNLSQHEKLHRKGTIACEYCSKYFLEADLEWHVDNIHSETKFQAVQENLEPEIKHKTKRQNGQFKGKESRTCLSCGEHFTDRFLWSSHMRKHIHKYNCPDSECHMSFSTPHELEQHFSLHKKGKVPCKIFGKNEDQLEDDSHENTEYVTIEVMDAENYDDDLDRKKFNCETCGRNFQNYRTYHLHVQRFHNDNFDDISSKSNSKTQSKLKKNTILKDQTFKEYEEAETRFDCQICLKSFESRKQLQSHSRVHNKSIPCSVCPLLFRTKYDMNKHFSVHERGLNHCAICNKNVKQIEQHMMDEHGEEVVVAVDEKEEMQIENEEEAEWIEDAVGNNIEKEESINEILIKKDGVNEVLYEEIEEVEYLDDDDAVFIHGNSYDEDNLQEIIL